MTTTTSRRAIIDQIAADIRNLSTLSIDLDAFLALPAGERAARWRQMDLAGKFQLCAKMLTAKYGDWDVDLVEAAIAHYDARWADAVATVVWETTARQHAAACQISHYAARADVEQRRRENGDAEAARWFERFLAGERIAWNTRCEDGEVSDLPIPPASDLLARIAEDKEQAEYHGDVAGVRQLDRLRANLLNGARFWWTAGDLIIQSVNTPGAVYSVSRRGCSCPNGAAGRSSCWHIAAHDLLLDELEDRAEARDILADAAAERGRTERELGRRLAEMRARVMAAA